MNNKLIIAAAGSGKTTLLVKEALKIKNSKVLITTFTEANEREIKTKFYESLGYIPENIIIQTWFSFLIQHGVKPYQSVLYCKRVNGLKLVNKKSGIRGNAKTGKPAYFSESDVQNHYFNEYGCIYSDKLSKFVVKENELTKGLVINRIGKIFSHIFIDEVQDMAGYDLEIIKKLFALDSNVLIVGDPRQVTYHTHHEAKYKKYADGKIKDFILNECKKYCVEIDDTTLNITYRNCKAICDFANSIYNEYKPCNCKVSESTGHDGVFFILPKDIDAYLSHYHPTQLRYNKVIQVNLDYPVLTFGESKGLTFDRVLIYPTEKMKSWILNKKELKPQSRSKLYVAITRAKYSVGIVFDNKESITVPGITNFYFQND